MYGGGAAYASAYPAAYGGLTYGGFTSPTGAMITERRDVDVTASGEVRISGIASTVDPATVQLRSLTDPTGVSVSEQRFVPGATTPDEILARHVGDQVTIVTPKGEVAGVLRSVDPQALVLEVGSGDQKRIQVMRRDGYVQDIRMPAGQGIDKPSLVWRLATKKPGKHTVEVTYRAEGLTWGADYLAIFDEAAKAIDFSAWATLRNASGTSFDGAEVTLVSGGSSAPVVVNPYAYGAQSLQSRPLAPATRYTVPTPVHVGNGESVQVELMPPRLAAKARSVVTFEAVADMSASYQAYPASDCTMLSATVPGNAHADVAVEIDLPNAKQLPDGKVRVFRRPAKAPERLEVLSEEPLRATAGVARIKLAANTDLTGERRAVSCNIDERAHTITEKVEVKLENKAKSAADVVVREFLWRYPIWKIDPADETIKGQKTAAQTQEYRLSVPAGGKKSLTYTVVYTYQ
ncbi:MAG: hypothetical protein HOV81_33130 [Kofleriaceae bacterium]|nr:hypothetical protein [Kofleriaceae bacterium]